MFFASSASSFQPAPYTPSTDHASYRSSRPLRSQSSLTVPLGMDPHPSDPNVVFVHPPFSVFPNAHLYPDGLTYSTLADNPDWFLDPRDFGSQPNSNTNAKAIPYPPHLEPPRGWCPAKKKDLKERGSEGWPEGEEPRLRCTFCRRTYAGVNAKSMWRRHVFEKHKVAMSNRRDGNTDRPRGRGSGKENRTHVLPKESNKTHDSLLSIVVAPQTAFDNISHKSKFRTSIVRRRDEKKADSRDSSPSPELCQKQRESDEKSDSDPTFSPPFTPIGVFLAAATYDFPAALEASPISSRIIPSEPPYNPLQTPSFRHSSPRLPSDQPWLYPSPSHPLHSNTRNLSLALLAKPLESPIKDDSPSKASPVSLLTIRPSPIGSPAPVSPHDHDLKSAKSTALLSKSIKIRSLLRNPIPSPLESGSKFIKKRLQQGRSSPVGKPHSFSADSLVLSSSVRMNPNGDPFSIDDSWPCIPVESPTLPVQLHKAPLEPESPVLRNGSLTEIVSRGVGMPESSIPETDRAKDSDLTELLTSQLKPETPRNKKRPETFESKPLMKKRRLSSN